jgi:tetratricopeptide (TPR) repeat protein
MARQILPFPAKVQAAFGPMLDWVRALVGGAPARAGRGRTRSLAVALALGLAAGEAPGAQRGTPVARVDTAAAREQARLCERKSGEEGVAACRAALALGIGPDRRGPIREMLARHLTALERWDEVAELLREDIRADPARAAAWHRLGLMLLFALDEPVEATSALEEAVRLAPAAAPFRVGLATALQATGHPKEAAAAFGEAVRLDPGVFEGRPAARAAMEAAGRDEPWP